MPVDEKIKPNSVCEVCGEEFLCGMQENKCWCFEIEISAKDLEGMQNKFKNCLCPKCLKEFKSMQVLSD